MRNKLHSDFSHSFFRVFVFTSLLTILFTSTQTASAGTPKRLGTASMNDGNEGYGIGALPASMQNALIEAVQSRPFGILDGGTYFVVGHYESAGEWGIGHLAAAVESEPPSWEESIWFITQSNNSPQVALQGTPLFDEFFALLPDSMHQQINPLINNDLSAQAGSFLFPWDKSQQWRYTYGWHGSTNLALDFAPSGVAINNMWILASGSGTVTLVCSDPYEAAIDLSTASGITTYRHIDYNSFTAQNINHQTVAQGQKLSLLYTGNQGEGYYDTSKPYPWPACTQGSSPSCVHIQFNTYCGAGTGAHVHWTLPAKPFTVDGWQVQNSGTWTKNGQSNKNIGAYFTSTNSSPWTGSTFTQASEPVNDGQIVESSETSGIGGTLNSTASILNLGDDSSNRQIRGILSFDTSSIPDTAVIHSVTLQFKYAGKAGTLPFSTHGKLLIDVRSGSFSNNSSLQLDDFKAAPSKGSVLTFTAGDMIGNWFTGQFSLANFPFVNLTDFTQFRLRFAKDDNNDLGTDLLKIYSGNTATVANRPQLIVEYSLP